jgi:hypothetical protein
MRAKPRMLKLEPIWMKSRMLSVLPSRHIPY